jgi:hypothetical protein
MTATRLALASLALLAACGYSSRVATRDGRDVALFVPLVSGAGIDVDVAALVDAELRRAVARSAGMVLAGEGAPLKLEVAVVDARTELAPFAEPGLRAAQYDAVVVLSGRVIGAGGEVKFEVGPVQGEAPYLSTGGRLEALDGAGRRALGQAGGRAAERLVGVVRLKLFDHDYDYVHVYGGGGSGR